MSFEQATYSFSGGHPPTPSRTPTSDSFDEQDAFSTPKLDAGFYDSRWENNDTTLNRSFDKTPKALQQQNRDLSTHAAHLLTTPNFALLSPQMPSPELPSAETGTGSLDSLIQTPPPTNSSGTKRREKQNSIMRSQRQEGGGGNRQLLPKPSEVSEHNLGSIASPPSAQQQFPFDFGSPGMFGGSLGPVTAPVFPQQRLFWDGNLPDMSMDFSTDDLFKTSKPDDGLEPFVSRHDAVATQQASFVDLPGGLEGTDLSAGPSPVMLEAQILQQQHQLQHHLGSGVDPNLLFSLPGNRSSMHMSNNDTLQPYAYQMQEAQRERSYAGVSKTRRRRKPSVDSPAVAAALESLRDNKSKPGLRRSMTDSFLPRSGRSSSSSSRAGTSNGRSSPLKQIREAKSRTKPSVELVIGPDGRARMETVPHLGKAGSRGRDGMEVDGAACTDGTDSSETEEDEQQGEQDNQDNYSALATSFGGDVGSSMLGGGGRFGSSAGHSQKSSYSSYYSSNSDSSRSRSKKSSSKRPPRALNLDPVREGGSFEDDAMVGREAGSAQQALMQSLKASQRGRYSPQKQTSGLEPFVSAPSMGANTDYSGNANADGTRRSMYR